MSNSLNDGLNKPDQLGSPIVLASSGNSVYDSLNGQAMDFGAFTGSGNTSVISFAKTFTAAPVISCLPTVGSVGVASNVVLSAIGTGSFSAAAGSNIAMTWTAIGSGSY